MWNNIKSCTFLWMLILYLVTFICWLMCSSWCICREFVNSVLNIFKCNVKNASRLHFWTKSKSVNSSTQKTFKSVFNLLQWSVFALIRNFVKKVNVVELMVLQENLYFMVKMRKFHMKWSSMRITFPSINQICTIILFTCYA